MEMVDYQLLIIGVGLLFLVILNVIYHYRLERMSNDIENLFNLYRDLCKDTVDKRDYDIANKYIQADLKDAKDHLYAVISHLGLYVRHYQAGVEVLDTKVVK
jgi:hypothetical protein